jgi:hypothetical protein
MLAAADVSILSRLLLIELLFRAHPAFRFLLFLLSDPEPRPERIPS